MTTTTTTTTDDDPIVVTADEHWVFYCRQCGWSPDPACLNQSRSSDKIGCWMHAGCPDQPTPGSIRWDAFCKVWVPTAAGNPTYPVLLAYPTGPDTCRAWCPPCATWHHHGHGPGHRVAHCAAGPYRDGGYILKMATDEDTP